MKRRNAGFTLIELLVVVLIIGILASIAIPQYFKVVEKSRTSEAMSLISAIKSAEERYMAANGKYTANLSDLDVSYRNLDGTTPSGSDVKLKCYSATISMDSGKKTAYTLTVKRHEDEIAAPDRYGLYSFTVKIPEKPTVDVACGSGAEGGENACKELIK